MIDKDNWKSWIDYNENRKWMFIVNIKDLIGEATEYDKKLALEEKKLAGFLQFDRISVEIIWQMGYNTTC